jgi:ADP-ribosylglycohydrolase
MQSIDYIERVYAGVLGKIIGVYLGRPFEGWTYEKIMAELGEIWYYVHEKRGVPLIVTDDDISGTFTFLRSMPDHGNSPDLTAEQIGRSWLNYLIEKRTVLWWGGLGNSTEHTAYLRLKHGIPAPRSGSCEVNGKVVSEQIGAQIFIDGWGMICPGDPERAADFARRAASVSHDGEAIYGAQIVAAIEALAFVEQDWTRILDQVIQLIPNQSVIYRLIADLRAWREELDDWRKARQRIVAYYGYDRYGGNCHMVPNHALIHLALLFGDDDFQKSLMIVNTSGWDTDCNSANVGCIMGIKKGLAGIDQHVDWRGPVADRIYLPTVDGGRAITDAVKETYQIINIYRALSGEEKLTPKQGARFHFELPGAMQGFSAEGCKIENVPGHSKEGSRSLAIRFSKMAENVPVIVKTPTFISSKDLTMGGYGIMASPTLYPGQTLHAGIQADSGNQSEIKVRLSISAYGTDDQLETYHGENVILEPGKEMQLEWHLPHFYYFIGKSIAEAGIEILPDISFDGTIYLDYLTWDGSPMVVFKRPNFTGTAWRKAWVDAVDHFESGAEAYRLIQDEGTGMIIQGCREWADYQVSADVAPHMVKSAGIAARVQGLQRYYGFLLCADGKARLIKRNFGDKVLAERNEGWRFGESANMSLKVAGNHLTAYWDGFLVFDVIDEEEPILEGAIALVVEEGRTATDGVSVFPI